MASALQRPHPPAGTLPHPARRALALRRAGTRGGTWALAAALMAAPALTTPALAEPAPAQSAAAAPGPAGGAPAPTAPATAHGSDGRPHTQRGPLVAVAFLLLAVAGAAGQRARASRPG